MEMLADAWGSIRGGGKSIWFELYEGVGGV